MNAELNEFDNWWREAWSEMTKVAPTITAEVGEELLRQIALKQWQNRHEFRKSDGTEKA